MVQSDVARMAEHLRIPVALLAMTERHTNQQSERWLVVLKGSRAPVPEKMRPEPEPTWTGRRDHDYTYGLSRASLRPAVPEDKKGIHVSPHPVAPKRRTRKPTARTTKWERRGPEVIVSRNPQPVSAYPIAEPVLRDVPVRRRIRYTVAEPRLVGAELDTLLGATDDAVSPYNDKPESGIDWQ